MKRNPSSGGLLLLLTAACGTADQSAPLGGSRTRAGLLRSGRSVFCGGRGATADGGADHKDVRGNVSAGL